MTHINTEVDVNAFYFSSGREMKSFPRRMNVGDRAVTFADGIRLRLQRGDQLTYFFDMHAIDEPTTYRLRQEGNQWTLVGTW